MIISDQTKDCGQIEGHGEQVCGREGQNKIFGGIRCLAKLQDKEDYSNLCLDSLFQNEDSTHANL